MSERILLIEDDAKLAGMVQDYLGGFGFDVSIAGDGEEGLKVQDSDAFDAVILDLMLPGIDGLEVCRRLRGGDRVPILMLTAKGDPMDRVVGLEIGADDYLPKPFEPRELLARLRAILRRSTSAPEQGAEAEIIKFGRLEIDLGTRRARIGELSCRLTAHQFRLLHLLAQSPGRVLSRDYLMENLTGDMPDAFDRSIDVHISRIRAEIEDDPKHPKRVITVRGAGYVFAAMQD